MEYVRRYLRQLAIIRMNAGNGFAFKRKKFNLKEPVKHLISSYLIVRSIN